MRKKTNSKTNTQSRWFFRLTENLTWLAGSVNKPIVGVTTGKPRHLQWHGSWQVVKLVNNYLHQKRSVVCWNGECVAQMDRVSVLYIVSCTMVCQRLWQNTCITLSTCKRHNTVYQPTDSGWVLELGLTLTFSSPRGEFAVSIVQRYMPPHETPCNFLETWLSLAYSSSLLRSRSPNKTSRGSNPLVSATVFK